MSQQARNDQLVAGSGADTIRVTRAVEAALAEMQPTLPRGLDATRVQFRQADFIATSIRNVETVLLEAAAVVAVVLILFLLVGFWLLSGVKRV